MHKKTDNRDQLIPFQSPAAVRALRPFGENRRFYTKAGNAAGVKTAYGKPCCEYEKIENHMYFLV